MKAPAPFARFAAGSFDLIAADPPWTFKTYSERGQKKSPQAHYSCLPIEAIAALPVADLAAADCWLLLWTCAPLLDVAFDVLAAWRFDYVSRTAWRKITCNGLERLGPGYVVRTVHEDILIARRGRPAIGKPFKSIFDGEAREHSRKPESFYRHAEQFAPGARRLDLFSRQRRPGWSVWGDQIDKFGSLELEASA